MERIACIEVTRIIDTDLDISVIDAYISTAHEVVNNILGSDSTISDELKRSIEIWFTAHLIAATREQQIQKASVGGADVTYQGMTGKGLEATLYGQQVLAIDVTGKMKALGTKRVKITAVTSFD